MQTESSPASAQCNSLGQQLRAQRLVRQMSVDDVAAQLRLPMAVIEAMENDDLGKLGAAVFARGRFGSYARLVGVPMGIVEAQFGSALATPPVLISGARTSRVEYALRRFARQGIYVVLTATIVLPVIWLATHHQLPQSTATLTELDGTPAAAKGLAEVARADAHAATRDGRGEQPVVASIAPFGNYRWTSTTSDGATAAVPAATAVDAIQVAPPSNLQMRFSGDSWIDVVGTDGRVIEHGIVEAGSVRNYQAMAVARITIGNSNSVLVLRNNEPLDIRPFQKANVARFRLSSDGNPVPVSD